MTHFNRLVVICLFLLIGFAKSRDNPVLIDFVKDESDLEHPGNEENTIGILENNKLMVNITLGPKGDQSKYTVYKLFLSMETTFTEVFSNSAPIADTKYKGINCEEQANGTCSFKSGEVETKIDSIFINGNEQVVKAKNGNLDLNFNNDLFVDDIEVFFITNLTMIPSKMYFPSGTGLLGVGMIPKLGIDEEHNNFCVQLKNKHTTEEYDYFIDYLSDTTGKVGFGGEPRDCDRRYSGDKLWYAKYDYNNTNKPIEISKTFFNGEEIPTGLGFVSFSIDEGMIVGNRILNDIVYRNLFMKPIKDGKCFIKKLKTGNRRRDDTNYYYYYYCTKEGLDKSNRHMFEFNTTQWPGYTFKIDLNSLYKEVKIDNGSIYYFFLMAFSESNLVNILTLGEPFLKKYTIVFNHEAKEFAIYNKTLVEDKEEDKDDTAPEEFDPKYLIILGPSIFVITIATIIFYKCYWRKFCVDRIKAKLMEDYEGPGLFDASERSGATKNFERVSEAIFGGRESEEGGFSHDDVDLLSNVNDEKILS